MDIRQRFAAIAILRQVRQQVTRDGARQSRRKIHILTHRRSSTQESYAAAPVRPEIPARHLAMLRCSDPTASPAGFMKFNGDESRYVGHGITCSTDEWADFKLAFENREERNRPSLVGLSPSGDLGNFHLLHGGIR
jgi:hypothetical protein